MKNIFVFLFFLLISLSGCVVEPATQSLKIINASHYPIYVYNSCVDSLDPDNPLRFDFKKEEWGKNSRKTVKVIFPNYRVEPNSEQELLGFGDKHRHYLPCSDSLFLFFFEERTVRNYSWNVICKSKMYISKKAYSENQLKLQNWQVKYK